MTGSSRGIGRAVADGDTVTIIGRDTDAQPAVAVTDPVDVAALRNAAGPRVDLLRPRHGAGDP